jgi:hypothetical protein
MTHAIPYPSFEDGTTGWNSWDTLHFWMVVIQDGGTVAVANPGASADLIPLNEASKIAIDPQSKMIRQERECSEPALANIGISPSDVDYVLMTPLQGLCEWKYSALQKRNHLYL